MNLAELLAAGSRRGISIRPNSASAWCFGFALVVAAAIATPLLSDWVHVRLPPYILFYPVVVLVALVGGPRIGITYALATVGIAWWFYMEGTARLNSPGALTLSSIYLLTSSFLGWAVGHARLALDDAMLFDELRSNVLRESIHRTKNVLAVVQAIVRKVYREAASREEYRDILCSRLAALGAAQDALIKRDWTDLPISTLVSSALCPFLPNPGLAVIPGPNLLVPARYMTGLCMALFELATNSMKYGALREGKGPVTLSWRLDDSHAVLEWNEEAMTSDGKTDGFGVKLIRSALGGESVSDVRYCQEAGRICASFRWRDASG
jgi:two-component sensor histidine kinase